MPTFNTVKAAVASTMKRSTFSGGSGTFVQKCATIPYTAFAANKVLREAARDSRLSTAERYRNRDNYVNRIRVAAQDLIQRGFLLPEGEAVIVHAAATNPSFGATSIVSVIVLAVSSPEPSSDGTDLTRYSPNLASSPELTLENMDTPKSLSKCHSAQESESSEAGTAGIRSKSRQSPVDILPFNVIGGRKTSWWRLRRMVVAIPTLPGYKPGLE